MSLSVCECEILSNKHGLPLEPLKKTDHPKTTQHDREEKRRAPEVEPRRRAIAGGEQVLELRTPVSAREAREN